MKKLHVKATFIEPVLGTWPANPNVAREFIASKSPDAATIEDEVAALGPDAVADKGMTVFPRDPDGNPIFYDYQIKGMFKDACGMLSRIGGKTETGKKKAVNESGKLTAYKKVIQGTFRQIPYWKLRGRFHSCGYRDQEVAKYIGIGRDTMSGRMQGHNPWTSAEITAMCELLDIRQDEIGELFFPSLEKGESA